MRILNLNENFKRVCNWLNIGISIPKRNETSSSCVVNEGHTNFNICLFVLFNQIFGRLFFKPHSIFGGFIFLSSYIVNRKKEWL